MELNPGNTHSASSILDDRTQSPATRHMNLITIWLRRVCDDLDDLLAVHVALLLADARDAVELCERGRPVLRERAQRRVAEDDVGGHTLFARLVGTPLAQPLEEVAILGRERISRRGLLRDGRPALAADDVLPQRHRRLA